MVKSVGAWPRPWGCGQGLGDVAVGHGQGLGGVAKAEEALPWPRGRGQGLGGVAKALGAWPRP